MQLRKPPAVILGRNVIIRGPLGVAVRIDTGSKPPSPIPAHGVRAPKLRS